MMDYNKQKEIKEAIDAGELALGHLYQAQRYLDSARGWGIFDIVGGGFISTAIKHSKLDNAKVCISDAQYALRNFTKELNDVKNYGAIDLNIGGFGTFMDFFSDDLFSDLYMQSKINAARENLDGIIKRIEGIVYSLRAQSE